MCKLPVVNDPNKIEKHVENFHDMIASAVVPILHDTELLSKWKNENGFTDFPGECGICKKVFKRSENGNFSFPRFKEHITKCNPNYEPPDVRPKGAYKVKW